MIARVRLLYRYIVLDAKHYLISLARILISILLNIFISLEVDRLIGSNNIDAIEIESDS